MAEPKVYDLKNATLKFLDGTGTPNELTVHFDEGNLTYTERREIEYKLDRGVLDYTREGDQQPLELNFEGRFHAITSQSGDPVTPIEFLTQQGAASAYVSTGGLCEPYSIDVQLEMDRDCGTTVYDERITFPKFRYEEIGGDFREGTLSVSGRCNVIRPTAIRTLFT